MQILARFLVGAAFTGAVNEASCLAQESNTAPSKCAAALTIVDESGAAHDVSNADLAKLPKTTAEVKDQQRTLTYDGAALVDVLATAGVEFGEKLKGRRATAVALLEATDGYHVVISLMGIDPQTADEKALVASRCDGVPLADKEGPLRLVMPNDKRNVRSIRMLRTIRVVNVADLISASASANPSKSERP